MADRQRERTSKGEFEMSEPYEAMVYSANLPTRTIAFIYQDGGPRLAGGIFRIERVRTATEEDKKAFKLPPADCCPLCGQREEE